jgi:hypothetical protein
MTPRLNRSKCVRMDNSRASVPAGPGTKRSKTPMMNSSSEVMKARK